MAVSFTITYIFRFTDFSLQIAIRQLQIYLLSSSLFLPHGCNFRLWCHKCLCVRLIMLCIEILLLIRASTRCSFLTCEQKQNNSKKMTGDVDDKKEKSKESKGECLIKYQFSRLIVSFLEFKKCSLLSTFSSAFRNLCAS